MIIDRIKKSGYYIGGLIALLLGILFFLGIIDLLILESRITILFQNNWLILIFQLGANLNGAHLDSLYTINILDICIMILFGLLFLILYPILKSTSKIWMILIILLPYFGIIIYLITGNAGRSGILLSILLISILMLKHMSFKKKSSYLGILAGIFLLLGDFTLGVISSPIISTFFMIGYVFLIFWNFFMSYYLFQFYKNSV